MKIDLTITFTVLISFLSLCLSLFTWIFTIWVNRKRLCIRPLICSYNEKTWNLKISFENYSRLPITITNICISINMNNYPCKNNYFAVNNYKYREGQTVIERKIDYNLFPPIEISALSAKAGIIVFDIPEEVFQNSAIPLILLIETTRGKIPKIELSNILQYNP
ncbi:MAG: hypothetical protein HFI34_06880 [Lachnospiraceae bacterium]|nr:hypothetical protein [Lachnospiraceae bacterium]